MSGQLRHGLSERETEIMDRHDVGMERAAIARELGIAPSYVASVTNRYAWDRCLGNSARFERMVRSGDRAYAAALAATGRSYA